MSIFDQFDESFLPGDRRKRGVKAEFEDYKTQEEFATKSQRSLWFFYLLSVGVMLVLISQLLNLQITHGSFNRYLAEGNRIRQREIPAPRGIIYDREGNPLVTNDVSFSLEVYPLDLPKNEKEKQSFYENLSTITQIPADEIKNKIKEKGFNRADPVVLRENIDRDTALLLEVKTTNMSGVVVGKNPIRNYLQVSGLSPILGYVGKVSDEELKKNRQYHMNESIGKDGVEKSYQEVLKGINGINEVEVDSRGRVQRYLSNLPPQPGNNLTLTIDSRFEEYMTKALADGLWLASSNAGAIVAMDPKTGGILGMVSLPTYDNNIFAKGAAQEEYQKLLNDEAKPMFNRAIAGIYPSGSTVKPLIASAGLQEGIITENTTIEDPGEIKVGSWVYPDWKAHGLVDIRKALAVSCNVFFYSVGGGWDKIKGLGVVKLHDYLEKFGFGSTLGIDLPGENPGLVPSPEWKEKTKKEAWYLGDTYHMAIGQGDVLVTPLQMATAIGSIANDGELLKPHLVAKITDKDGNVIKNTEKEAIRPKFIDGGNLQIVREGMRLAVTAGSATALNDLPVQVAAKTGTAQFGNEGKTHAWLAAFAPYYDPQIVLVVIIEGGGEGYATAGPVAKDILNWYFSR